MRHGVAVQLVEPGADWRLQVWPAVPRVGDYISLTADDDVDRSYCVAAVVWDDESESLGATVYLAPLLGQMNAHDVASRDMYRRHAEMGRLYNA